MKKPFYRRRAAGIGSRKSNNRNNKRRKSIWPLIIGGIILALLFSPGGESWSSQLFSNEVREDIELNEFIAHYQSGTFDYVEVIDVTTLEGYDTPGTGEVDTPTYVYATKKPADTSLIEL